MKRMKHGSVALTLGTLMVAGLLGFTAIGAQAATSFFNGFETDTSGWFGLSGSTITQVASPSTWSNPGYADNLAAATGTGYARLGLATPATCTNGGGTPPRLRGPYTDFGGYESTFPTGGYSTKVDVYLDVTYAINHPDTRFDWDSANNARDFVFNVGTDASGFVVNASNSGDRCAVNPYGGTAVSVTTSGWYTFKHTFTDQGGLVVGTLELIDKSTNTAVGTWVLNPGDTVAAAGGHTYGWFVQNEFDGLAIDNSELKGVAPSADLGITKSDSPDPVHIGQKLTYTIVVTNNGPDDATGVMLRDDFPKTTGFGSVSTTQGTCSRLKTRVTCSLGTMANGSTATVTLLVKPTQKGTITNTVTVTATSPVDPNLTNNSASQQTLVKP